MPNNSPRNISSENAEPIPSLNDRVVERVMNARLVIESQPTPSRPSAPQSDPKTIAEQREIQSLKRVFRDMGSAYRRYRSQTKAPVVPGLRDAAYNFRAEPSLPALIGVAAYLDKLDLLS